jgi:hypothetical protein
MKVRRLLAALMVLPLAAYGQTLPLPPVPPPAVPPPLRGPIAPFATTMEREGILTQRTQTMMMRQSTTVITGRAAAAGEMGAAEAAGAGRLAAGLSEFAGAALFIGGLYVLVKILDPDPTPAEIRKAKLEEYHRQEVDEVSHELYRRLSGNGFDLQRIAETIGVTRSDLFLQDKLILLAQVDNTHGSHHAPDAHYDTLLNNGNQVSIVPDGTIPVSVSDYPDNYAEVAMIDVLTKKREGTLQVRHLCSPMAGDWNWRNGPILPDKPCLVAGSALPGTPGLKYLKVVKPAGYKIEPPFAYVMPLTVGAAN